MKMKKIMVSLKKNKIIDSILRIFFYPLFRYQYYLSDKVAFKRRNGFVDNNFEWIKQYQNSHVGERCFIVATGPSLTIDDLELIRNEFSFSMNSSVLVLNKTNWVPKIYMIQDEYVYDKLEKDILNYSQSVLKNVWICENIAKKYGLEKSYKEFPLHLLDHKMYHRCGYGEYKFSDNCYETIYDGYTITFSVMQMAVYMGFKELYLLGCDCNYNQSKLHFVEYGHKDPKAAIMGDKMIAGHIEFKKFADAHGVKVINCTRGGMLEVYPRMKLEDVLEETK